jgi:hypothetical protein
MNIYKIILLGLIGSSPITGFCGTVVSEFEGVNDFTDFSVSGLSEEKTLAIFLPELNSESEKIAKEYLAEGETLTLVFTDIDMAGDIQPWRNRNNADIRYVEAIYPPRLKFRYTLTDASGEILKEGEVSDSDIAFQLNVSAGMRGNMQSFFYEMELLNDWARKTLRDRDSSTDGE